MTETSATHILRDDHKRLTGLLRQLEAIEQRTPILERGIRQEIYMEIEIHSAIEIQTFYPALLASFSSAEPNEEVSLLVDESIRGLREIEEKVQRLRLLETDPEGANEVFEDLTDLLQFHIIQEERITLPIADALLASDDLLRLGAEMRELRKDLLKQPQYDQSRPEVVQNPNGGEQMRRGQPHLL